MDTRPISCVYNRDVGSEPKERPSSLYQGRPFTSVESNVIPVLCDNNIQYEHNEGRTLIKDQVTVICDKPFLADCLKIVLQSSLETAVEVYASIGGVPEGGSDVRSRLVLISIDNLRAPDVLELIGRAKAVLPNAPIVVLAYSREPRLVRQVLECGVKGYIPMTMGFAVAIEAVRFILAGGTYIPPESLVESDPASSPGEPRDSISRVTLREMAIIQAIQQGKSNKIIAYELSLCESTVKVHIRNIMKKLRAKNRTEVAVRSAEYGAAPRLFKAG